MSNNAKKTWNTQKTPTKHVLRLFKNFLKIWFSAQKSGSRLRCRTMLKIHWNTQKTPTKHVLRLFEKFLKIRFSAQKYGSQHRFRTMLKYLETLRKQQLNMFWGFLRYLWKSGSRLKNQVLGPDVEQCYKYFETLRKHQLNTLWGILRNFCKSDSWLKIRFSAHMSNNAKIPWNTQKTATKHVLRLFKTFVKIRFSAQKSGSRPRYRTMLKNTLKHSENTN